MFLRKTERRKNGKTHLYWSVAENRRLDNGRVIQRHVLYLGEINSCKPRRGEERSRSSTRTPDGRGRSRCSPRIVARRPKATT